MQSGRIWIGGYPPEHLKNLEMWLAESERSYRSARHEDSRTWEPSSALSQNGLSQNCYGRGPQDGPRWPKRRPRRPKTAQKAPKTAQEGPKRLPKCPKGAPKRPQEASKLPPRDGGRTRGERPIAGPKGLFWTLRAPWMLVFWGALS